MHLVLEEATHKGLMISLGIFLEIYLEVEIHSAEGKDLIRGQICNTL